LKKIAVIGGGASGLIAACFAAEKGNRVILFEKQKKLGRKVLVTGNGRCNISNRNLGPANYHGRNTGFAAEVLGRFGLEETVDFFNSIGLPFVEEEGGRLYPASLQSSSVVSIFEYELLKRKVDVRLHRRIDGIKRSGGRFVLETAGNEKHDFDSVILAPGSCAFPAAGASRTGYELARSIKHRVYEPFPSILPLNIPLKILHRLQGIKIDCGVSVFNSGRELCRSRGEVLFTSYGISGPAALDVSRCVNEYAMKGDITEIEIDLYPGYSEDRMRDVLMSLWKDPEKRLAFSLFGLMRKNMPEVILGIAGLDPQARVGDLDESSIERIIAAIKRLRIMPGEPRGFDEAVVAAGGVDVEEVNPHTMESKIMRGLYITGELLDIDGDSGGYNLQFAWSTGALAGMAQRP